jgi:hypothetical protein
MQTPRGDARQGLRTLAAVGRQPWARRSAPPRREPTPGRHRRETERPAARDPLSSRAAGITDPRPASQDQCPEIQDQCPEDREQCPENRDRCPEDRDQCPENRDRCPEDRDSKCKEHQQWCRPRFERFLSFHPPFLGLTRHRERHFSSQSWWCTGRTRAWAMHQIGKARQPLLGKTSASPTAAGSGTATPVEGVARDSSDKCRSTRPFWGSSGRRERQFPSQSVTPLVCHPLQAGALCLMQNVTNR